MKIATGTTASRAWLAFILSQTLLVSIGVAATVHRLGQLTAHLQLPVMRNEPLQVKPQYDYPEVVTDEQLANVLHKLRPRLRHDKPKINHIDHALRFWGLDAQFKDPECLSGEEMRAVLLHQNVYSQYWGDHGTPLLRPTDNGVSVRTQEGEATASHVDHTIAGLGEIGIPLDYAITTRDGPATVRDMLAYSLREFSLNQREYEWSTLAYVLYLPPTRLWISSEGQEINFDRLAERIMRQRLNQGVCMGNHRLHTLVMLLRIDEQIPILEPETRQAISGHLLDVTRRFMASQHMDGYWTQQWPDAKPPNDDETGNTLSNRILATGHVLEWWSLAPREVHPPREVIVRGGQWLAKTISELDDQQVKDYYTFLTHAGRALALWRGDFPASFLGAVNALEIQHDTNSQDRKDDAVE